MSDVIRIGQLEIRFLCDKSDTGGSIGMFELTVPPGAKVPAPHYHRDYDEAVYGLSGALHWKVDGKELDRGQGEHIFIPRGAVHVFENRGDEVAVALTVLTPDLIGRDYFRELSDLFQAGGPPDPAKVREIMLRYGLVPVPPGS